MPQRAEAMSNWQSLSFDWQGRCQIDRDDPPGNRVAAHQSCRQLAAKVRGTRHPIPGTRLTRIHKYLPVCHLAIFENCNNRSCQRFSVSSVYRSNAGRLVERRQSLSGLCVGAGGCTGTPRASVSAASLCNSSREHVEGASTKLLLPQSSRVAPEVCSFGNVQLRTVRRVAGRSGA